MRKLVAMCAVAVLSISGCGGQEASRQAAPAEAPPACANGLSTNCIVSTADSTGSIAVRNGARVLFEDSGKPARTVVVSEVCWADEDDVDPNTCVTGLGALPTWLAVEADSTLVGGESWPTYSIAVDETSDSVGERFFPLPARVTFIIGDSKSNVAVEVACCDSPARR
jgi:hypothetical protein